MLHTWMSGLEQGWRSSNRITYVETRAGGTVTLAPTIILPTIQNKGTTLDDQKITRKYTTTNKHTHNIINIIKGVYIPRLQQPKTEDTPTQQSLHYCRLEKATESVTSLEI